MPKTLLILSGPIAVGKTTLRNWLVSNCGFCSLSSSTYLRAIATERGLLPSRTNLQILGDDLDDETDFRWVVDAVAVPAIRSKPSVSRWLFDSVRKRRQLEHFRAAFGESVLHAHLTAPEPVLRARFEQRKDSDTRGVDAAGYESAISHPNELEARSLVLTADIVVDTDVADTRIMFEAVLAHYDEE